MTATDTIRAMLDERGMKYKAWDGGVHPLTVWHDELLSYEYEERRLINGAKLHTGEVLDGTGRLSIAKHVCSPEQAIEATLGRGECMDTGRYCFTCSECGWTANEPHHAFGGFWPNYCPNCGRAVKA